jgi:hypothetical protein
MRNFSWSCFQVTGSIDAYLLYKEMEALAVNQETSPLEEEEQQSEEAQ